MKVALLGNAQAKWCTEVAWAGSFEAEGHQVRFIQEGETRAVDVPDLVRGCDLFVWVETRGLAITGGTDEERRWMIDEIHGQGVPTVALHLDKWFGLARESQLSDDCYFTLNHVFTADGGNQDRFAALGINHHWMLPGVYEVEAVTGQMRPEFVSDVGFVGNWRGNYHTEATHRHALVHWLRGNYADRMGFWPRGQQIRGADLSDLYASVKVLVGDSCLLSDRYISDRVPETLGRGGFLLHPWVRGIDEFYTDGKHLRFWEAGDWGQLRSLIDYYVEHDDERREIAAAGREHVLAEHTYRVRVRQVLATIGLS